MLIEKIKKELAVYDRPENKIDVQRFHKEKIDEKYRYAIKTPLLRKVSNKIFMEIKSKPKEEILKDCDRLLESSLRHRKFFAFEWASKIRKEYKKSDFARFESWLKKYVNDWGACDHICGSILGYLLKDYPELFTKTTKWTKSKNRWLRRAAAVSLIIPVRNGKMLDKVFKTADILLMDEDDMVQKGYGWMLKEAGNRFEKEVFEYVMKNRKVMPRTALRYAIEKMPAQKRREAMQKD